VSQKPGDTTDKVADFLVITLSRSKKITAHVATHLDKEAIFKKPRVYLFHLVKAVVHCNKIHEILGHGPRNKSSNKTDSPSRRNGVEIDPGVNFIGPLLKLVKVSRAVKYERSLDLIERKSFAKSLDGTHCISWYPYSQTEL
jgi:hypothetical protein